MSANISPLTRIILFYLREKLGQSCWLVKGLFLWGGYYNG